MSLSHCNLQLEASLTSDFPSLLALNSMRSGKYDGLDTPTDLAEKPKYLASPQYKNGTVVSPRQRCACIAVWQFTRDHWLVLSVYSCPSYLTEQPAQQATKGMVASIGSCKASDDM